MLIVRVLGYKKQQVTMRSMHTINMNKSVATCNATEHTSSSSIGGCLRRSMLSGFCVFDDFAVQIVSGLFGWQRLPTSNKHNNNQKKRFDVSVQYHRAKTSGENHVLPRLPGLAQRRG